MTDPQKMLELADDRNAAYERLLKLCVTRDNPPGWDDILTLLRERKEKRMNELRATLRTASERLATGEREAMPLKKPDGWIVKNRTGGVELFWDHERALAAFTAWGSLIGPLYSTPTAPSDVREALKECASRCRYDGDLFHDQQNEQRRDASWKAQEMAERALASLSSTTRAFPTDPNDPRYKMVGMGTEVTSTHEKSQP